MLKPAEYKIPLQTAEFTWEDSVNEKTARSLELLQSIIKGPYETTASRSTYCNLLNLYFYFVLLFSEGLVGMKKIAKNGKNTDVTIVQWKSQTNKKIFSNLSKKRYRSITHMKNFSCQLASELCCCCLVFLSPFLPFMFATFHCLAKDNNCYLYVWLFSHRRLTEKTSNHGFHRK